MTDDEKFDKILVQVEAIAKALNCQYAVPVDEKADGTLEVHGIIIGGTDFIASIVSALDLGPVENVTPNKKEKKPDNDDDPTFH